MHPGRLGCSRPWSVSASVSLVGSIWAPAFAGETDKVDLRPFHRQTPSRTRWSGGRVVFGRRGKSGLHGDKAVGNAHRERSQGKRHRKQTSSLRGGKGERVG